MSQYGKWGRAKNDGFAEILTDRLILRRIASIWAEIKSGWVSRKFRWMSFFVNGDRFSSEEARNKKKLKQRFIVWEKKRFKKVKNKGILMESHWRHVIGVWNNRGEAVRQKVKIFLPPKTVDYFRSLKNWPCSTQGQFFKPELTKISLRACFEPKLFY